MIQRETCAGRQHEWALLRKLGEGDAGEVYTTESTGSPRDSKTYSSILKRPRRSPFQADIIRQSTQIEAEGRILQALEVGGPSKTAHYVYSPHVLDTSPADTAQTERFFIVIEAARGFDLSFLSRVALLGRAAIGRTTAEAGAALTPETYLFLHTIAQNGRVPEPIILKTMAGLLDFFEHIHTLPARDGEKQYSGLLWNDVKSEHLFWEPTLARLTIIDWGNSRFLNEDGATSDRQNSVDDDYRQFLDEMGRFLSNGAPELKERLKWPSTPLEENIKDLRVRIQAILEESLKNLRKARQKENALLKAGPEASGRSSRYARKQDPLQALVEVQKQIVALGEMPDYTGALPFSSSYAGIFIQEGRLETLRDVADWVALLPDSDSGRWQLISRIAQVAIDTEGERRRFCNAALEAAVHDDWESALWELAALSSDLPEPDWWRDLLARIRFRRLELGPEVLLPLVSVKRALLAVQSMMRQMEDRQNRRSSPYARPAQAAAATVEESGQLTRLRSLAFHLNDEVIPNWLRQDPSPPHAALPYSEVDALLGELKPELPELAVPIEAALTQPRQQVEIILQAWNNQEFSIAARALRLLLLWDPDRRRVLKAELAILSAPGWLELLHRGPGNGQNLQEYATGLELEGRDLRNQVGSAAWLDPFLEALKQLRRGAWPGDLLSDPHLARELPWLEQFRRRSSGVVATAPSSAADPAAPSVAAPALKGIRESHTGLEQDLELYEPLDAWIPEARGSSARVFLGHLKNEAGLPYPAAIKLMRVDLPDYALPLFHEEVEVLRRMQDVPGVTPLIESGFIRLDSKAMLPPEPFDGSAAGALVRIGLDQSHVFQQQLKSRVKDGWVPYLAIEKRDNSDCLVYLCDAGLRGGRFLPLTDLVRMTVQICDILQIAHERSIVYRDHKILHYYWNDAANGIYVIDWNVARYHPDGLSDIEIHMDLVQFAARALHHILTGRTAPGALPLGPTRPEEIEAAATSYTTQWTYDDQRLSADLKGIIEKALAGSYLNARQLGQDLKLAYLKIG